MSPNCVLYCLYGAYRIITLICINIKPILRNFSFKISRAILVVLLTAHMLQSVLRCYEINDWWNMRHMLALVYWLKWSMSDNSMIDDARAHACILKSKFYCRSASIEAIIKSSDGTISIYGAGIVLYYRNKLPAVMSHMLSKIVKANYWYCLRKSYMAFVTLYRNRI